MPKKIVHDIIAKKRTGSESPGSSPHDLSAEAPAYSMRDALRADHGYAEKAPHGDGRMHSEPTITERATSMGMNQDMNHTAMNEKNQSEEKEAKEKEAARIDASPLFQKMKERRELRGSFTNEFTPPVISGKKGRGGLRAAIAGILFILLIGIWSVFGQSAVVSITPKQSDISFAALPLLLSAHATGTDHAAFHVMTVTSEETRSLTPTGEEYTEKKASGKITIYNEYGTEPQRLVKNTRFQSPDGKIYRIGESVTVPGMKKDGGKNVPGTLETAVYADLPGAEYNIGPTTFTVPGFKGSPQYDKFSGKSAAPIEGGFQGNMKVVAPGDLAAAKAAMEQSLRDQLWKKALAERAPGTVLWPNIADYEFSYATSDAADGSVSARASGKLSVLAFDSKAVSHMAASRSFALPENEEVLIENIADLTAEFKDVSLLREGSIDTAEILLSGNAKVVWQVDTDRLASALVGVKKKEYSQVFSQFPGLERARVTITPFWKTRFPSDVEDIRVEIAKEGEAVQ